MARLRPLLTPAAVVLALLTVSALSGLHTGAFSDFETEAQPAVLALQDLDFSTFFDRAPTYGGSLLLRAPLLPFSGVLGGGVDGAFRAISLGGLLAVGVLAIVLFAQLAAAGRPRAAWLTALTLAAPPMIIRALETGHAEELLGAALVAGAATAAVRDRPGWCGLLLGAAMANKAWAGLAVLPIAATLQRGHVRAAIAAAPVVLAGWLPFLLTGAPAVQGARELTRQSGEIFQPWQLWWWFGEHHGDFYSYTGNLKVGYRQPPEWFGGVGRPSVLLVPIVLAVVVWGFRRMRHAAWRMEDGLALLALTLLLRCLLDPWNTSYYGIPFLFALVIWELHGRGRPPVLAAVATALTALTLVEAPKAVSADLQSALYLAWTVPLAAMLLARLTLPERSERSSQRVLTALERHLPRWVSLLREPAGQLPTPEPAMRAR